jgi:hypothetical protein
MDWTDLNQDMDQRWTLVNKVENLQVPQKYGKFCSTAQLAARQEELSSMESVSQSVLCIWTKDIQLVLHSVEQLSEIMSPWETS